MNTTELTIAAAISFLFCVAGFFVGFGTGINKMETSAVKAGVAFYENNRTNSYGQFTFITNK